MEDMPVTKSQVWFGRMFTGMPRIQLKDDEQGFPISCFISAVEPQCSGVSRIGN